MSKKKRNDKDIQEISVHSTPQLDLFSLLDSRDKHYSNSIDIYDALPKYSLEKRRRFTDIAQAAAKERECRIGDQIIRVRVRPALIETEPGKPELVFPGEREEIIEDALRKLAVNGGIAMIDGKVGVLFTFYQLRNELRKNKHEFKLSEIKEAILVCRGAQLETISDNEDTVISSSFFPMVGLTTRQDIQLRKGDTKCYVQFNPLVTDSIKKQTFRLYDYSTSMAIKSPLARYIHKRMSHHWSQASSKHPYTPRLVSFLKGSPRGLSREMASNVRAMKTALETLIKHNVIEKYDASERIMEGPKLIDIKYKIYPTDKFVKVIKKANYKSQIVATKNALLPDNSY